MNTILVVSDDTHLKTNLTDIIQQKWKVNPSFTVSFEEAIKILSQQTCSVVIGDNDLYSNDLNINFLQNIKQLWPKTVRILLMGENKDINITEMINQAQIFRVFDKSSSVDELVDIISESIDTFSSTFYSHKMSKILKSENKELSAFNKILEDQITSQIHDVESTNVKLSTTLISSVKALSEAVEAKDAITHGHSERVALLSTELARGMGLSEDETASIEIAALLHDIGKIGISEIILNKPGVLTQSEMELMRQHPVIGYNIVTHLPFDSSVSQTVLQHHENFDGSGYPNGIAGHNIILGARIIHIADAFDTMTTSRPYNTPLEHAFALEELKNKANQHFDPDLIALFIEMKY